MLQAEEPPTLEPKQNPLRPSVPFVDNPPTSLVPPDRPILKILILTTTNPS